MRSDHELLTAAQEAYFGHTPLEVTEAEWERLKELAPPAEPDRDALLSGAIGQLDGIAIKVIGRS